MVPSLTVGRDEAIVKLHFAVAAIFPESFHIFVVSIGISTNLQPKPKYFFSLLGSDLIKEEQTHEVTMRSMGESKLSKTLSLHAAKDLRLVRVTLFGNPIPN